jgi:hypothetical protein
VVDCVGDPTVGEAAFHFATSYTNPATNLPGDTGAGTSTGGGPAAPTEPTPATVQPGTTGVTRTVAASGAQFTTITAAIAAASAGDTIQIAAGTYHETFDIPKPLKLVGAGPTTIIDGTGLGYSHQRGLICPLTDCWIEAMRLTNVVGTSDTVAGIRPGSGCIINTKNLVVDNCMDGFFSGDGYPVNWFSNGDTLSQCGNDDGFTHNIYLSGGVVRAEFLNLTSTNPKGGHALKSRASLITKVTGGTLSANAGSPFDIPDASYAKCVITGTTLSKPADAVNSRIGDYGAESVLNGTGGIDIISCSINAPCPSPFVQTAPTTTMTFTSCTFSGNQVTGQGGGTIVGLP